jgi:predicted secreted hydrolase
VPASSRLSELLSDDGAGGYPRAIAPRQFEFPRDHGPHPAYRNEWWYFTGNLEADGGERFGYELTLFRFALAADAPAQSGSAWSTNQVFIGHFAVTDVPAEAFHVAQRYSRGAVGLAGATSGPFSVWLDDWRVAAATDGSDGFDLRATDDDISLALHLVPLKPVILNGEDGLSRKSDEPGNASYYYSIPRLATSGRLQIGDREYPVDGLSWLDREWGSSALSREQAGWDWFALQLADGSDFMFYVLRGRDGLADRHSAGTWVAADGTASSLGLDDVEISVTDTWQSDSGGTYPAGWQIRLPDKAVELRVRPVLRDQELATTVRYWEGAVDVTGRAGDDVVSGRGYVELTGYVGG